MKDKRISFRLDSTIFSLLEERARQGGYSSAARLVSSLSAWFATAPLKEPSAPTDEIDEYFEECEVWQKCNGNRHDINQRR